MMLFAYLPTVVAIILALLLAGKYFLPRHFGFVTHRRLLWWASGFIILFAAAETLAQYWLWTTHPLGRILLTLPLDPAIQFYPEIAWLRVLFEHPLGYFFFYVAGRFWLNAVLMLLALAGVAFVFWIIAKFKGIRV